MKSFASLRPLLHPVRIIALASVFLIGCSPEPSTEKSAPQNVRASVTPNQVTAFGYDKLRVVAEQPIFRNDPVIRIGGNAVYDVEIESPTTATFYWQGSPATSADIDVESHGQRYRIRNALTVMQPAHPAFERMVNIGASFGQGVISESFDQDTQIHAPSAQVARAVGAYFPLPLTKRGYIPGILPEDFEGTCKVQDSTGKIIASMDRALSGFQAYNGRLEPHEIRLDPDIEVRNASVGGEILGGVIHGAVNLGMPILMLLEHLVYDPRVDWPGLTQRPRQGSELDYIEALKPTLVMTTDIAGNDLWPSLNGGMFDGKRLGNDEYFRSHYRELFSRLGPDVWVFIADLPDATVAPGFRRRRTNLIAEGYSVAEVDAGMQSIRDRLVEINAILAEEAAKYPRAVIVPFSKILADVHRDGMRINGQDYTTDKFGGFISLDGLHLTYVGYGMIANGFITEMNKSLGISVPLVDLDAVSKVDPLAPNRLAPYGLTPVLCPTD